MNIKYILFIVFILLQMNSYSQPMQTRILIATSPDGLIWNKTSQIFNDSADVPDAIIGTNGKVFVYFQGLLNTKKDGIMVSISENGFDNWKTQQVIIPGTENWKASACDPDVIYKDGVFRLYFTGNPDNTNPRTFSATSIDGINFTMESGYRFAVDGSPIMDPSLLQIGDTLHYFAGGAPLGKNWHCTSLDGINFTKQADFTVNNLMMANGLKTDNGYRFYCFKNLGKEGIYSIFSNDGINWTQESGLRLILDNKLENEEVKDPAVVKVGNQYIMYYVTRKSNISATITANKNATKETNCILAYLNSLNNNQEKKIISGQMTNNGINSVDSYNNAFNSIYSKTGKFPGIAGFDYERDYPQKLYKISLTNKSAKDHFRKGGLVVLMWSANNPWTGGNQNDLTGSTNLIDLITKGTSANNIWMSYLDSIAKGIKELQDSGVVVLWRPLHEMNGNWFWWGSKSSTLPSSNDFQALWKHMFNYFTNEKGLNNIIWVYSAVAKSKKVSNPVYKDELFYYPGDEFVDIIGIDVYSDTLDIINYNKLITMKKPLALTEFGCDRNTALNKINSFDYMNLLNQIKTQYPKIIYWMSWNDFITNSNKDTINYSMINQKNSDKLLQDKWVINLNDITWKENCGISVNENGPWNSPLKIAFSSDGTNFINDKIFQDSAGVPSVIKWNGDTLICAFQWFREPRNSPTWDRVAVKFSYNKGLDWTEPKPIIVKGLPQNYQRPFDPTLVVTDNGKLRIYYSSSNGPVQGLDSSINTYSAISDDGINYTFEPNPRYDNPQQRVIDPAVIKYKDQWHYLSPKGAPQDGAFHCISNDGLLFSKQSDFSSDNNHNWTGNFMKENENELRFYGCGPTIWFNKSDDGFLWKSYINTNINGGDPSVVKIADNSYLMIYVGAPANNTSLPEKVVLISPINNQIINQNSVNLNWFRSKPNVGDYHLQVSLSSSFKDFIINDSTKKDSTRFISNLQSDTTYFWRVRARNPIGWGEFSYVNRFKYETGTDITENFNQSSIIISPNPAGDFINLRNVIPANAGISIEIFNIFGERTTPSNLTGLTPLLAKEGIIKIDISNLAPGVYFVRVGDRFEKFVKL